VVAQPYQQATAIAPVATVGTIQVYISRNLTGAPPEEIASEAIRRTYSLYDVRGSAPEVVYLRRVTASELPRLGLGIRPNFYGEEPPLMFVLVRGDFDMASSRTRAPAPVGNSSISQAHYVAFVYNLRTGNPIMVIPDSDGARFGAILNNPDLPGIIPTDDIEAPTPSAGAGPTYTPPPAGTPLRSLYPVPSTMQPIPASTSPASPQATVSPGPGSSPGTGR
jgi:hypothetical protein